MSLKGWGENMPKKNLICLFRKFIKVIVVMLFAVIMFGSVIADAKEKQDEILVTNQLSQISIHDTYTFKVKSYNSSKIDITFSVDKPNLATIHAKTGYFKPKKPGSLKVTAKDGITGNSVSFLIKIKDATNKSKFLYSIENKEVCIQGADESLTSITIPCTIDGYPVTRIRAAAFSYTNLKSISIPESVTDIGTLAFEETPWLKEQRKKNALVIINNILIDGKGAKGKVVIPSNVTIIAESAFSANQLITEVVIPDSVHTIKEEAFRVCRKLTKITFGNGLKVVETKAFEECELLKSAKFNDGLISIGEAAFLRCYKLDTVVVPSSVTEVGGSAFSRTPWIDRMNLENDFVIINGILISSEAYGEVTIPSEVRTIASLAFFDNAGVEILHIPETVTVIESEAFSWCVGLEKVYWPNSVSVIPKESFVHCKKLETISIPDGVTAILNRAFFGCESLKNVSFSSNVTDIGSHAFTSTPWLDNLSEEKDYAVVNGHLLKVKDSITDVKVPNGVVKVCGGALSYRVKSVTLPSSLITIGEEAFNDCWDIKEIKVPKNVKVIEASAFYNCSGLTKITLPEGLIYLGESAFSYCAKLKNLTIPNTVTKICNYAVPFDNKNMIITLPDKIKNIEIFALGGDNSNTVIAKKGSYGNQYANLSGLKYKAK